MNTTKMTYAAALTYALDNLADAPQDVLDKLSALREQQTKRGNYVSKAEAAKQEANAVYAQAVLAVLADGAKMTVSDMMGASDELGDLSNQKVTAVVKSLLDAGQVVKTVEKRKAFFTLAA